MQTTLTSKGQVTIPKHIRDALHLEPGCPIEFRINRDGEVVLKRPDEGAGRTTASSACAARPT